jgi:hypothetical protein
MKRHALTLLVAAGIAAVAVAVAAASAVPVGKLPPATKIAYKVTPDKSVTLTLPRPAIKGGVWRVARAYDSKVVYQQGEQTLPSGAIRITLHATDPGTTRVVYALTKGETAKAYAARIFEITVGDKPPPATR